MKRSKRPVVQSGTIWPLPNNRALAAPQEAALTRATCVTPLRDANLGPIFWTLMSRQHVLKRGERKP